MVANDLIAAASALEAFAGARLTSRIAALEGAFAGTSADEAAGLLRAAEVSPELLASAYLLKRVAGEVNVVIHAVGILLALPRLLEPGERVEALSLGAGNTGRTFDLETDQRVAEFKFIHWQGGSEVIRQNALFKDFYQLAEHPTAKRKFLYVLGTRHALKFLHGHRALRSVLSRNVGLRDAFRARHGERYKTVSEYYADEGGAVTLEGCDAVRPGTARVAIASSGILILDSNVFRRLEDPDALSCLRANLRIADLVA